MTTSIASAADLGKILLEAGLKGALVFVIAAVAAWSLRRRPAAARHGVWSVAMALQLALPFLAVAIPAWSVPILPSELRTATITTTNTTSEAASVTPSVTPSPTANQTANQTANRTTNRTTNPTASLTANTEAKTKPSFGSPALWLATLWLLGCMVVLARLALGTAHVSRMAVEGERVLDGRWLSLINGLAQTLGIRRPLTLLRGSSLAVPVTWGIVYPIVLLPDDADQWPEERRRYVLVHEMAHVKRLDALTQLIGQLALAIFWFNPLTWIASRRLIVEREHACDDYVLRHGTKPSEYATDLLDMVRSIGTAGHRAAEPAFAALAMARRSEFEGRMLSILDPDLDRKPVSRTGAFMSIAASLLIALPLAAFSPFATHSPSATPSANHAKDSTNAATPVVTNPGRPAAQPAATETRTISGRPVDWMDLCDTASLNRSGSSNHVEIHDSPGSPGIMDYVYQGGGKCVAARFMGSFTVNGDESDVVELPWGSSAFFRERTSSADRQLRLLSNGDGEVQRAYRLNGTVTPYDDDARRWFASFLPAVLRESAFKADERVTKLRAEGGVPRVLQMISGIRSSNAKRAHYEVLLDSGSLNATELEQVLRQAKRDLASNSGDLAALLERMQLHGAQSAGVTSALADVIGGIQSDGDKARTVTQIAMQQPGDPDVLLAAMNAARTIRSDGDKANFLITASARYLTLKNDRLRTAYFEVADSIVSDGDLANVLITAAQYGHADENVTRAVIRSSLGIQSSGDKANVLIMLAGQHLLTSKPIREDFVRAAATIGSDGDRANVLAAAIQP